MVRLGIIISFPPARLRLHHLSMLLLFSVQNEAIDNLFDSAWLPIRESIVTRIRHAQRSPEGMKPLISALLACDFPKPHDHLWMFLERAVQSFLSRSTTISFLLDIGAAIHVDQLFVTPCLGQGHSRYRQSNKGIDSRSQRGNTHRCGRKFA